MPRLTPRSGPPPGSLRVVLDAVAWGRKPREADVARVIHALNATPAPSLDVVLAVEYLAVALAMREKRVREALVHVSRVLLALGAPLPTVLCDATPPTNRWVLPATTCTFALFTTIGECYGTCADFVCTLMQAGDPNLDVSVAAACLRHGIAACTGNVCCANGHFPHVAASIPPDVCCPHNGHTVGRNDCAWRSGLRERLLDFAQTLPTLRARAV